MNDDHFLHRTIQILPHSEDFSYSVENVDDDGNTGVINIKYLENDRNGKKVEVARVTANTSCAVAIAKAILELAEKNI